MRCEYKDALLLVDSNVSLPNDFCIITPCNPNGQVVSPEENERLYHAFKAELESRGTELIPVTGSSQDFAHREPGFAIPCSLPMGVSLARKWKQEALYRVQYREITLVDCNTNAEHKIAKLSERVVHPDKNIHAAARLGRLTDVQRILETDPSRIREPGLDGQLPLHFAGSIEVAEYLLDERAEIDARDVDHESTAAQYMLGDRQPIARFLIRRGAKTDILMAAALGDEALVNMHLQADPTSIRLKVSDEYFPMVSLKNGGTIYQWIMGWYVYAHQVALKFGHRQLFEDLLRRSPADLQLTIACSMADRETTHRLLRDHPNILSQMPLAEQRQLAHMARNNHTEAALLMLDCGYPIHHRSQHGATTLHWAAWHGNKVLVERLLKLSPDLRDKQNDFGATPLGWAEHGQHNGWYKQKGDYPATIQLLKHQS